MIPSRDKARMDEEFTVFVDAAKPELLRIAWFLAGDVEKANELVQASLVRTYVAWGRVRHGEAVAYTRRVMVNHRTDQWRRTYREVLVEHHAAKAAEHQRDEAAVTDTVEDLVRALRSLPEQQRRVVVLRYYCDLSERQVAAELRISVGAVKSTASRGLHALRRCIHEMEEWSR